MSTKPDQPNPSDRSARWLAHLRVLQLDEHLVTSFAGYLLQLLGAEVAVAERSPGRFEGEESLYVLLEGRKGDASPDARFDFAIGGPVRRARAPRTASTLPLAEAVLEHDEHDGAGPVDTTELIAEAVSGWLVVNSDPERAYFPLKAGGFQVLLQAGVTLAMLGLAAHRGFRRGGGAPHYLLSIRQLAATLQNDLVKVSYWEQDVDGHHRHQSEPSLVVECHDGLLFVVAVEDEQFQRLCTLLGCPELAGEPAFATKDARHEHFEALYVLIRDALQGRSRDEIADACATLGIPTVPVYRMGDLLVLPQLRSRGFWRPERIGGTLLRGPSLPWTARRTAAVRVARPPRGAAAIAPLSDILISETSWVWAGPFASELLVFLGARAIKVESDRRIDLFRRMSPLPSLPGDINAGSSFNQLNLDKQSAVLDLGSEAGRRQMLELLGRSDVFISNFRPGVLDSFGLTQDALAAVPGLIAATISGYGSVGPWARRVLYGSGAAMVGGLAAYTGYPETLPTGVGFAFGDPCSGNYTALAVLAALTHRDRTGEGALIDLSMLECILLQSVDAVLAQQLEGRVQRLGNGHPRFAPHGVYACAEEESWVALAVETDDQWQRLAVLLGLEKDAGAWSAAERRTRVVAIDRLLDAWARARTAAEAADALSALGIAAAVMQTPGQILADPALRRSGYVVELDHPVAGRRLMAGPPWTVDGERLPVARAPLLGEHTSDVLALLEVRAEMPRLSPAAD